MTRFDELWKIAELNRRQVLASGAATGFVTGFAMSTQPVSAQTMIVTDTAGLVAKMETFPAPDGKAVPVYRAYPKDGGPYPIIVVVQEIFGVHEHIKDVCRRLAKQGYYAIAPSLFDRQGDVTQLKSFDEIRPIVSKVPDAQVMSDIDAAIKWAVKAGPGDEGKIGITGFCWGGRIVWLYAAHNNAIKAGVAWYGRLVGDKNEITPSQPVDLAPDLEVPVLGLYGGADTGIPVATVDQMKQALGADSKCEFQVYPDAPHAFFADYRPSYREAAAKDAWGRMLAWFKDKGLTPS
jgi:carboxymethylenebutenolidase